MNDAKLILGPQTRSKGLKKNLGVHKTAPGKQEGGWPWLGQSDQPAWGQNILLALPLFEHFYL